MVLIEVLLPVFDNAGSAIDSTLLQQVAAELTERFGGLTAHTRAPATGLWKPSPAKNPTRDDIVIFEVMTQSVDKDWWHAYRLRLEERFRQEHVIIRAIQVQLL